MATVARAIVTVRFRHTSSSKRREKVEVGLIFDFRDVEKPQVYPLRYTEDFSMSRKSESNPRSAFAAGRGFAELP
jgi:hypothetical protein